MKLLRDGSGETIREIQQKIEVNNRNLNKHYQQIDSLERSRKKRYKKNMHVNVGQRNRNIAQSIKELSDTISYEENMRIELIDELRKAMESVVGWLDHLPYDYELKLQDDGWVLRILIKPRDRPHGKFQSIKSILMI